MIFPLKNYIFDIPENDHVGAFLKERKFHMHEGIDLYCQKDDEVFSIAEGVIMNIVPFTGTKVNSPWWNDTEAVIVKYPFGSVVYGEITALGSLYKGKTVKEGELIGFVTPVLKKRKENPINMLHIEYYDKTVIDPIDLIKDKRTRTSDFYKKIKEHGLRDPLSILKNIKVEFEKSKLKVFLKQDTVNNNILIELKKKFETVIYSDDFNCDENYDIIINNKNYLKNKRDNNIIVEYDNICADLIIDDSYLLSKRRMEKYSNHSIEKKAISRILEFFY